MILRIIDRYYSLGKDIILRITYDTNGHALENEPYDLDEVLRDAEAINGILETAGEKIFIYQGLLVGNWGEMHTSRYADSSSFSCINEKINGGKCYFAVRRPDIHRQLHDGSGRLGLFDDAIFGSESDMGTYADPDNDILYEEKVAVQAPNGGEAVYGGGYIKNLSDDKIISFLQRKRVTYLNNDYDPKVLNCLREKGDLYNKISSRLGYRLFVRDVRYMKSGNVLRISVTNKGFAPVYRETESSVILTDADGNDYSVSMKLELKGKVSPDDTVTADADLSEVLNMDMKYPVKLSLMTRRSFDGKVIRYANISSDDGSVFIGELR